VKIHLEKIQKAQKLIAPYIKKTPLIRCYALEEKLQSSARIFLKCDHLQLMNSFKVRGAFNVLLHLSPEERKRGVVTRSAGNFASALAYACHLLHIPATLVMPEKVPKAKLDLVTPFSPTIFFASSRAEEEKKVEEIAQENNLVPLSPYSHLDVIAGQGTAALEIFEELPSIQTFFCPLGGGGLMSGTAIAFKELNPAIQTVAVEPTGANDYFLSRQSGQKVRLDRVLTIADGLVAPTVGDLNYPLLNQTVDRVTTVSDEALIQALRFLYEKVGMIVEPSGAASVAALLAQAKLQGDTVCFLSGGNVQRDQFYQWIEL
jgi:threonine dehydratase